jgi:hypothetical protein
VSRGPAARTFIPPYVGSSYDYFGSGFFLLDKG